MPRFKLECFTSTNERRVYSVAAADEGQARRAAEKRNFRVGQIVQITDINPRTKRAQWVFPVLVAFGIVVAGMIVVGVAILLPKDREPVKNEQANAGSSNVATSQPAESRPNIVVDSQPDDGAAAVERQLVGRWEGAGGFLWHFDSDGSFRGYGEGLGGFVTLDGTWKIRGHQIALAYSRYRFEPNRYTSNRLRDEDRKMGLTIDFDLSFEDDAMIWKGRMPPRQREELDLSQLLDMDRETIGRQSDAMHITVWRIKG